VNPYDKAHELARSIRSADAYVRLKAAKERIEQDLSVLGMIQDFRKRQWELQTEQMMGQEPSADALKTLQNLAEVVQLNADAREYLQAEYQVSQLAMDVQRILSEVVEEAMLPAPLPNDQEVQN
jgi:cell fate (sporulation/competence/biofilm development) regulator YlbF (YheA/YmcA/DUF963 family)